MTQRKINVIFVFSEQRSTYIRHLGNSLLGAENDYENESKNEYEANFMAIRGSPKCVLPLPEQNLGYVSEDDP